MSFKLRKQSKKDKKDKMGMPCILGKDGKLKVTLQEKIKVWKEYEEKLMDKENYWNISLEWSPSRIDTKSSSVCAGDG